MKEWDELVKRYPHHTHSRRQRMLAYGHLGDLLGNPNYPNLGDFQGARQALDTVVEIAKTLHNSDNADTGAWIDYGVALMHRAGIPGDSVQEQIARLQQAKSVLSGAEKASPENVSPPMNIAALSEQIGDLLKKSGRKMAAVQEYKESLAKADQLIGTGRVSASRIAVMVSGKLAEEEARSGKAAEALNHCRKAIEVGEKAAKTANASATQQSLALRAYATMGSVQQILGNQEEARRLAGEVLDGISRPAAISRVHRPTPTSDGRSGAGASWKRKMTRHQARLVRESFEIVREVAQPMTVLFYGRLFDLDPNLRPLFKIDIREQSRKLVAMLALIVDSLETLDKLRPQLQELGRRHVDYGVRPEHYATLSSALLWALGQALDTEFSPDVRAAWTEVIETISATMLEGTENPVPVR